MPEVIWYGVIRACKNSNNANLRYHATLLHTCLKNVIVQYYDRPECGTEP